jgi:hypothetical protein
MTGSEHYREAERAIAHARELQSDNGPGCGSEEVLAEAQVHATLALAAATAEAGGLACKTSGGQSPWHAALNSEKPTP